MNQVEKIIQWFVDNKEWVFSGIGVSVISALVWFGQRIWLSNSSANYSPNSTEESLSRLEEEIKISVERAVVKYLREGHYWVQLNLRFSARNQDTCLKYIRLKAPGSKNFDDGDSAFGEKGLRVSQLQPHEEMDILRLSADKFYEKIRDLDSRANLVRDLPIPKSLYLSVTISGDFYSERLSDGWEDLPLRDWRLIVDYGDNRQETINFCFSIHRTSPTYPVQSVYYGFEGRIIQGRGEDYS